MTATVHDALGRMVAVPTEAWKTDGLAPGAYFIRISSGSQPLTRKVLLLP